MNFHLDDVIADVLNNVSLRAQEKGIELRFSLSPEVPLDLRGDPLRLGQVLVNLVGNGVKFTERGEVTIDVQQLARHGEQVILRFSVIDQGIGMSAEQVAGLFHAFSQADASTTRMYGGTGLGLAICKRLVALMGGDIQVESEPGLGSAFSFTVPLSLPAEEWQRQLRLPPELSGMRILVVDDSRAVRLVMERNLNAFSCRVRSVASGEEALTAVAEAAAAGEPFDLVFMDWVLPGMDGLEAGKHIKAAAASPAVILVTAYSREEVGRKAEEGGLEGFLVKPITRSSLLDALMTVGGGAGKGELSAPAGSGAAFAHRLAALAGARVLVVEDNEINQQVARELLENAGLVVEVAADGKEGFAAVQERDFDLVFMDIQMPGMDGNEACRRIRAELGARGRALPVVAMTAHVLDEERERSRAAGMNDYISKPLDPEALYQLLLRWIEPTGEGRPAAAPSVSGEAADDEGALPELPGIDVADGLARMAGNVAEYRRLLLRFGEVHADIGVELQGALARRDLAMGERLAHTLKGSAGTIGAKGLQQAAVEVEQACRAQDCEAAERALARLEDERARVFSSLALLAENQPEATAAEDQPLAAGELPVRLAELAGLLREYDTAARHGFEGLRATLAGSVRPAELERLARKINSYDFDGALVLLGQIAQGMQISLEEEQ